MDKYDRKTVIPGNRDPVAIEFHAGRPLQNFHFGISGKWQLVIFDRFMKVNIDFFTVRMRDGIKGRSFTDIFRIEVTAVSYLFQHSSAFNDTAVLPILGDIGFVPGSECE